MRLKTRPVEVDPASIYENDRLRRKEYVDNLTVLLSNVEAPLVLSINAPWGAGKTTFLKMLHANLAAQKTHAVYFSAWETDFAVDPLLAFLGEMNAFLSSQLHDNFSKRAWEKAKSAGGKILKRIVPVAVKVGTAGAIDLDQMLEDEASNLAEALSSDLVEGYVKNKELIDVFKESIRKLLDGAEDGEGLGRLCIFVDELDRCRPTYAIELLERIKHLLDIPGLIFVLALDKAQLAHSVKAVYGADFDAAGYLKRFIDIEYGLPEPDLDIFVDYLFECNGFEAYFRSTGAQDLQRDGQSLLSSMQLLAKSQRLSLRSIEQLFTRLKLLIISTPTSQQFHPDITLYLIYLKEFDRLAYEGFVVGGFEAQRSIDLITKVFSSGYESSEMVHQFIHAEILSAQSNKDPEWVRLQIADLKREQSEGTEIRKYYAGRVIQLYEYHQGVRSRVRIQPLIRRVEMLENFQV